MKQERYYQRDCKDAIIKALREGIKNCLAIMATGCHAKGTPILMYDGTIKLVEDVIEGDKLMGDNNTPRNVLSLARGNQMMYKITPVKGDSFVVNENHILSLKRTGVAKDKEKYFPKLLNISIKDYLFLPKSRKHCYKQYRIGIDMPNIGSSTHPYWIGLWLGDGTFDRPTITTPDKEVQDWCLSSFAEYCSWNHPEVTVRVDQQKDRCSNINFVLPNGGNENRQNSLLNIIRTCTSTGEKRIPYRNLRNSRENRLELLAGLLDTDGHYNAGGFEIITKYNGLSEDILFLARSLGFAAYKTSKKGEIKKLNFIGYYWRIFISGDLSVVPCKIARKKASIRKQIKDVLVTGFSVEPVGNGDYYGFELDGNHLYCMGDFTVTHNTGKTYTTVSLLTELQKEFYPNDEKQLKVLWGTHSEELVSQSGIALLAELDLMPYDALLKTIEDAGGLIELLRDNKNPLFASEEIKLIVANIGIVKADLFDTSKRITICSMQTIHRRLDKIPADLFDVMVCDEAHLFGAKTFIKSIQYFKVRLLLGLTATATRMDGMKLGDIFDKIVYEYSIDKGITDGFLCELDARRINSDINLDSVRTTAGEFNQRDLEVVVNTEERNQLIVDKYKEYALGRQFAAYCVDVQHAVDLKDAFVKGGINAEVVVGDETITPERKRTLAKFANSEIDGLTNCMVLTTGWDFPDLGCVIHASPTKSLTKYIQCTGRGTRLKSKSYVDKFKQECIILDVVDNTSRHKLINTWTLDKAKTIEEKTFLTKKQKIELIEKRDAKYRVADPAQKGDVKVDLFKLPEVIHSTSYKMQDPASEKQLALIAKHGYDIVNINYTKLMCAEIISSLPAWDWCTKILKAKGYDVSGGVTLGEWERAKMEIEKREEQAKREAEKKQRASKIDTQYEDLF